MANDARQSLIDGLNEDLAHEYQAIISYLLYSRLVTGPLRPELSSFLESEIEDELEHAKFLSHKIALGGEPTSLPAAATERGQPRDARAVARPSATIERYTRRIEQARGRARAVRRPGEHPGRRDEAHGGSRAILSQWSE